MLTKGNGRPNKERPPTTFGATSRNEGFANSNLGKR